MNSAEEPLARTCSRQTCRRAARSTLTFVYADSTAVIGPLSVHAEPHAYDLCEQHARSMTPPRGWEIVRLQDASEAAAPQDERPDAAVASAPLAPIRPLRPASETAPAPLREAEGASASSSGAETGASGAASSETPAGEAEASEDSEDPEPAAAAGESAPEPGSPSGRGWGRRRRGGRLSVVPALAPAPEESPDASSPEAQDDGAPDGDAPEDDATASEQAHADGARAEEAPEDGARGGDARQGSADQAGPWGGLSSLTDEIFAGERTELVKARSGLAAQPPSMRLPHLRRPRRTRDA